MVEVVTKPMHFSAVHRLPGGKENARIIIVTLNVLCNDTVHPVMCQAGILFTVENTCMTKTIYLTFVMKCLYQARKVSSHAYDM
jgi:hypothetical protein